MCPRGQVRICAWCAGCTWRWPSACVRPQPPARVQGWTAGCDRANTKAAAASHLSSYDDLHARELPQLPSVSFRPPTPAGEASASVDAARVLAGRCASFFWVYVSSHNGAGDSQVGQSPSSGGLSAGSCGRNVASAMPPMVSRLPAAHMVLVPRDSVGGTREERWGDPVSRGQGGWTVRPQAFRPRAGSKGAVRACLWDFAAG